MSKETEKIFRGFEKYLKDREIDNDQDLNGAISDFMEQYNKKASKKKGKDAWDYMDMAYEAETEQEALKYARKALQMDSKCLDAEVMIAEMTSEDMDELKTTYEKLIEKAGKDLKEADIFNKENMGHFWGIVETRPYMRLRYSYVRLLLDQGKFRKAIGECEDMLQLCESDNLGVRYLLISLYAFFEDELNVIRLHKRFDGEASVHMLLPITALYYKLDDYKKAESYLKKLKKINDELEEVFCGEEALDDDFDDGLDEVIESGMYRYGSKEEIMVAMTDAGFLYTTTAGFYLWMADRV